MLFKTEELKDELSNLYPNISDKFISVDRPKFYGQYFFSVSLSEDLENWHNYYENKDKIQSIVSMNGIVSGSKTLLTIYCFINNINILKKLIEFSLNSGILIQSIKIISDSYKNIILKRNKYEPKGPWFGTFNYRIRLTRPFGFYKKELSSILDNMSGKMLTSYNNPALLYLENVKDVLLFKLFFHQEIIEIYDYSVVRP